MVNFWGTLSLLLAADAATAPAPLINQARESTKANPVLRKRALARGHGMKDKIMKMAVSSRKLQNYDYNYNYGGNYNNNGGNDYNNGYQQQQANQYQNQQGGDYQQQNAYGDGNDQYQWSNNGWNNGQYNYDAQQQANYDWDNWQEDWYWNQAMEQEEFGFAISEYSMKFEQCATVETYSDDLADDEFSETVLAAQRFAIFRLCPSMTCSSRSNEGCSSNYGEYVVSLDQYLAALMEEEEERVIEYCNYCQECATIESAKYFWEEVEYRRLKILEQVETNYQQWIAHYQEQVQQQDAEGENAYMNANMYNNYNNGNYGNYQQNANGYNNNYQNGEDVDEMELAQRYYQYLRNRGDYANDYSNKYGNNGNQQNANAGNDNTFAGGNVAWTNQYFWDFETQKEIQSSKQNAWANMGSGTYAEFFGKHVMNGYFDQNGDFIEGYGFFNSDGQFVSLEEEYMDWDEGLFGEMPDGWNGITMYTESCTVEYAASCYNQYDSCMMVLNDYDYWYVQAMQSGNYHIYGDGDDDGSQPRTVKEFMACTQYEFIQEGNDYANQDYYAQKYQEKQEYFEEQYNCYEGDEQCEAAREYALQKYEYDMQKELNRKYYIGPHCSTDGHTIALAVYQDEYCSVIDEDTSATDLLGYDPLENVELVPQDCIACGLTEEMIEQNKWYEDEDRYNDGYQIEPMCSMLYQLSGKCNKDLNMNSFNYENNYNADWEQMYQSEQQKANEEAVCSFVESLKSNTYDENGQVVLSNSAWKNPTQWSSEFQSESRALSPGFKAAIALMSIAVAVMAVWACFLHGTLARKNIPWRPRRKAGEDPTDIARQNSGIVMGRSRSGPGGAPLI